MEPNQPPIQQPAQNPIQVPSLQPKQNYLKTIIFSVLIVMTLGLITYLYFQNQKLQKQVLKPQVFPTIQASSLTPKIVSSFSIPSDKTANWQTYINTKYKYSLQYPLKWQVKENVIDVFPNKSPSVYIFEKIEEFAPGIYIWIVPKIEPKQWITEQLSSPDYALIKTENITIVGIQGVRISGIPGPLEQEWVFLNNDNKTIVLYAGAQKDMSVFDQVLSTFKFINAEDSASVMGINLANCCPCPKNINKSQVGKDSWVIYENGRDYTNLLPKQCSAVICQSCGPL